MIGRPSIKRMLALFHKMEPSASEEFVRAIVSTGKHDNTLFGQLRLTHHVFPVANRVSDKVNTESFQEMRRILESNGFRCFSTSDPASVKSYVESLGFRCFKANPRSRPSTKKRP